MPRSAEPLTRLAEKLTGWRRPAPEDIPQLVSPRQAQTLRCRDDGVIPNHPRWPAIHYRGAVRLPSDLDPAAVFEDLFKFNDWEKSWRGGIYDYVHYHSRTHEVLGIARGKVKIKLGGNRGRMCYGKSGDVFILPAGTGHQCLGATDDFLAVGAYPPHGTYDECTSSEDHACARKEISKVKRPAKDPVYGRSGPLKKLWAR